MTDLQAIVNERNNSSWWDSRAAETIDVEAPVYVWRCSVCGKWSHARKRPDWHTRGVEMCGPFDTYEARKLG